MKSSRRLSLLSLLLLLLLCSNLLAQKPELVVPTGHSNWVERIAISPDGKLLASGSTDTTIRLWDAASGTELRTMTGHTRRITSLAFSPDSRKLASGSQDGTVRFWDLDSGLEEYKADDYVGEVSAIAFSPDGAALAVCAPYTIGLWDAKTGKHLRKLAQDTDRDYRALAFSPDGSTVAVLASGIRIWEVSTGKLLRAFDRVGAVRSYASTFIIFSPDAQRLVIGASGGTIILDAQTGAQIRKLEGDDKDGQAQSAAFSPDAKVLATAGGNHSVKLWDASTGLELHRLKAAPDSVLSTRQLAFSRDGRSIVAVSGDKTIRIWDAFSGREMRTLKGYSSEVNSIAFSRDGKLLASGNDSDTVKLWDVATGREMRVLRGHTDTVYSVAFSPDGKILASGSKDGRVILWDFQAGASIRALQGPADSVKAVAFSPDGKMLASAGTKEVILWEAETGTQLRTLEQGSHLSIDLLIFSPDGKSLHSREGVWDVVTGKELDFASAVKTFSPDGTIKATGSSGDLRLWNVETQSLIFRLAVNSGEILSAAFSPNGRFLASASDDSTVTLWDVTTGYEIRTFKGHTGRVRSVAFSRDGRTLASASSDSTIRLWDVARYAAPRLVGGHSGPVADVAYSSDGLLLASSSRDQAIKLRDARTGRELRTLEGHTGSVLSIAFSPDKKLLASSGRDGTIRLWEVQTGKTVRTLIGHTDVKNVVVGLVAFNHDGRILASADNEGRIKLWDVATGKELRMISGLPGWIAFSPDGKTLAGHALSAGTGLKLWDVATGRELRTFDEDTVRDGLLSFSSDGKTLLHSNGEVVESYDLVTGKGRSVRTPTARGVSLERVNAVALSPDGRTVAAGVKDLKETRGIKLWDASSGTHLGTIWWGKDIGEVRSLAFTRDGRTIAAGTSDGKVLDWETPGPELASLIAIDQQDWAVVVPDGRFDGSPLAWSKMIWRSPVKTTDFAPVEAYFNEFYYPGLLVDVFDRKLPEAPKDISQRDRRRPILNITLNREQTADKISERMARLRLEVSQGLAGALDVRLFRNGSLVKLWRGDVLQGKSSVTLEATVPIVVGENRFTAYAFNRDNIKSSDATLVVTGAESLKRQGAAYVLAVGVNTYSNTNYNLKYAVPDAEDFAAEIKRQQDALKKFERVEVIALYDKDATKPNILQKLSELGAKAQPEDAVIVYFSGHGTAAQQRFYLIPHDLGYQGPRTKLAAADLKAILDHSISDRELEQAFEKIDAGQLLMVIDACNSGQALDSEEKRRGPMNSKGLAQLAYEKGMYILTAAQSYQAAWEASRLGHGYLTYALIEEGLKQGTADREPKDNQIVLREWLDYATERVPQMQEEKLKETPQLKDQQGRELEFVFIEGDETIKDPSKRSIQRPRVFYRREIEALPMIVARPPLVAPR